MSSPQHFASTVLAGFKAAYLYTDKEVGAAGGPSTTTMTKLRKVAEEGDSMTAPRGDTLQKIDRAAKWSPGSTRALWEHGTVPVKIAPEAVVISYPKRELTPQERRRRASEQWLGSSPETYRERIVDWMQDLEERVDALERAALEDLSEESDTTERLRAADNRETSISGEQAEPDLP